MENIEQIVSIVGWCLTGIAVLMVLIGFLVGLKRGLNKSLFRFAWITATILILLFTSSYISKGILNMDMNFLHLSYNNVAYASLADWLKAIIQNNEVVTTYITNPEILSELAINIPLLLGNLVVFLIVFWLAKWILWPFWAIIANNIDKKAKELKKQGYKKEAKKMIKPGWGGLVGAVLGLTVTITTFVPIIGINNMVMEVENGTTAQAADEVETGLVTALLTEYSPELVPLIRVYADSPVGKTFETFGLNKVGGLMFDQLASINVDGKKIKLSDEVVGVANIAVKGIRISEMDFENLTNSDITMILSYAKDMVREAFSSGVLNTLFDELVPDTIDAILNDPTYEVKIPHMRYNAMEKAARNMLTAAKNIRAENVGEDVVKLIEIAQLFHEEGIVMKLYQQDWQGALDLIKNVDADRAPDEKTFAEKIADKIFEASTVSTFSPVLINSGVELLCEITGATFEENTDVNTALKAMTTTILDNMFKIAGNVDIDSAPYVNLNDADKFGNILDAIFDNDLLTESTYNSLMAVAQSRVDDLVDDNIAETDINTQVREMVNEVFTLINSEEFSFAGDFAYLGNVAANVWSFYDSGDYENFADYNLGTIGSWVDDLTSAQLISTIYTNAIDVGFAYIDGYLGEIGLVQDDVLFIKTALKSLIDPDSDNEMETELAKYQALYNEVIALMGNEDIASAMLNKETLQDIGVILDNLVATNPLILNDDNIKSALNLMLKVAPLPEDIASITLNIDGENKTFVEAMQSAVSSISSYEKELNAIGGAVVDYTNYMDAHPGAEFKDIPLATIGEWFDSLMSSDMMNTIYEPFLNYAFSKFDEKAVEIGFTTGDLDFLKTSLISINNTGTTNEWTTELGKLQPLFDKIDELSSDPAGFGEAIKGTGQLTAIGTILDNTITISNSSILTLQNTRQLFQKLTTIIPLPTEIASIIITEGATPEENVTLNDQLLINIGNLSSFATECGYIEQFMGIDFNAETLNFEAIGAILDDIKLSDVFGNLINPMISYFIDEYGEGMDAEVLAILEGIKDNLVNVVSYETEMGYLVDIMDMIDTGTAIDLTTFGTTLDTLNGHSQLFDIEVLTDIINYGIDQATNSMPVDVNLSAAVTAMKGNVTTLLSTESVSFATEIGYLKNILDVYQTINSNLTTVGTTFDDVKANSILMNGALQPILTYGLNQVIDGITDADVKTIMATDIPTNLANMFGEGAPTFATEFGLIDQLLDIDFSVDGDTLSSIGTALDSAKTSTIVGSTVDDLFTMTYNDQKASISVPVGYESVITDIDGNLATFLAQVNTGNGYAVELGYIESFEKFITGTIDETTYSTFKTIITGGTSNSQSILIDDTTLALIESIMAT